MIYIYDTNRDRLASPQKKPRYKIMIIRIMIIIITMYSAYAARAHVGKEPDRGMKYNLQYK